jgi:selenocysteine lyase/cysteine desulfurase
VLRPLYKCVEKYGVKLSFFNADIPIREAITPLIQSDTKFIISTLSSNVTGKTIEPHELANVAKENNLKLILDASQYLGHKNLDLKDMHFSALCCAGHKSLFGIQGSSFVIINDTDLIDPLCEGGSGIDSFAHEMPVWLPERFEAGTLSTPSIGSLYAGIEFIKNLGIEAIEKKLSHLTSLSTDMLRSNENITLYGAENGIMAFNLKNYNSSYVSDMLDKVGIATRSGFHCAPIVHEALGTTERGAVRVSFSYFNSEQDIYRLAKALESI